MVGLCGIIAIGFVIVMITQVAKLFRCQHNVKKALTKVY